MKIAPAPSIISTLSGLPAQAPAASQPVPPAVKAAEAAMAELKARQQVTSPAFNEAAFTAASHKSVAHLPRGSLLNIVV